MFFQQMLTLLTDSSQLISDRISLHKRPSVWPLSRRFYIAPSLLIESRQQVLVVEESCLPRGGRILKELIFCKHQKPVPRAWIIHAHVVQTCYRRADTGTIAVVINDIRRAAARRQVRGV